MKPTDLDPIEVVVVDYDPAWAEEYAQEARRVEAILGDLAVRLFHIGSTSVPGLKAKPIIDIMPVVTDIARLDSYNDRLAEIGYEGMGEFGIPDRRYFRKGGTGTRRTHQMHAFQYDDTHNILRHLAFRDYLRARADVRDAYAELKSRLARQHPHDIGAYCDGKDGFVKQGEREALCHHWRVNA